jgi:hypothetical protein
MTMKTSSKLTRAVRRAAVFALALAGAACVPAPEAAQGPRSTLFIGIDVSGSFRSQGRFDDAVAFVSHYIHAHLNGYGGLEVPRALFVGPIGGDVPGEPHAFRPIHDFMGKEPAEIEADLRNWLKPRDRYTDFSAFFERAATLAKRQNLVLAPITLVVLSDGEPDLGRGGAEAQDSFAAYKAINLEPLEYLSRNVTVRLLYADPAVAVRWERYVPRSRVRLWTVDRVVMAGWHEQLKPELAPADQAALWKWVKDIVDFRVRRSII